ncbi:MAG: hypothetical protein QOF83_162 [Solirubrobacteraceae bacterium]|nr:hypothetical protein [Solirubrobacteraceae bacterium]
MSPRPAHSGGRPPRVTGERGHDPSQAARHSRGQPPSWGPPPNPVPADAFVALSAALTGFRGVDLWGTGQVSSYLDELVQIVGEDVVAQLLATGDRALGSGDWTAALETMVLDDPDLGPVARSLIILWYLGQWSPLPNEWRDRHGASPFDVPHVVSADAYTAGLVWMAIGAHPMGANPGGYGSWATPPSPMEA